MILVVKMKCASTRTGFSSSRCRGLHQLEGGSGLFLHEAASSALSSSESFSVNTRHVVPGVTLCQTLQFLFLVSDFLHHFGALLCAVSASRLPLVFPQRLMRFPLWLSTRIHHRFVRIQSHFVLCHFFPFLNCSSIDSFPAYDFITFSLHFLQFLCLMIFFLCDSIFGCTFVINAFWFETFWVVRVDGVKVAAAVKLYIFGAVTWQWQESSSNHWHYFNHSLWPWSDKVKHLSVLTTAVQRRNWEPEEAHSASFFLENFLH